MNKVFTSKTILNTLIGTAIAGVITALPIEAKEDNLVGTATNTQVNLSQSFAYSDSPTYSEPSDNFKLIVGLTGLAVGTGVVGYHLTKAYKPSLVDFNSGKNKNASPLNSVSPRLRRELLRLVHNKATASRLLSGTLTSNPDRTPNWAAEKVIYDLKRGR